MRGMRSGLAALALALLGVAGAQSFLPEAKFGEPCTVVLERVLAQEGMSLFGGSECGGVGLPEPAIAGEFSGFKASYFERSDGLSVYILYFYFEDDRLAAVTLGSTMGFESLNAIAETSYGPYYECFDVEDSGMLGVACLGFSETAVVRWVRTDIHSSLTLIDPTRFDAPVQTSPEAATGAVGVVDGFQVVSFDTRWEEDTLWAFGEVRNVGGRPAGVELQVIARDASGRVVDVATFWPASTRNIRPGASYGFRHQVTRERSAVRFEVQVVGTQEW